MFTALGSARGFSFHFYSSFATNARTSSDVACSSSLVVAGSVNTSGARHFGKHLCCKRSRFKASCSARADGVEQEAAVRDDDDGGDSQASDRVRRSPVWFFGFLFLLYLFAFFIFYFIFVFRL